MVWKCFGGTTAGGVAALLAVLSMFALSIGAPAANATGDGLAREVSRIAGELDVPGMAVEIVDSRGVVDRAVWGKDGNDRPIDERTPFVWGSVSKSFAGLIVSRLAARGELTLDTPVTQLLPEAAERVVRDRATTVSDLVHHTSGLPHDMARTDDWSRRGRALDAIVDLGRVDNVSSRGVFRYSSLNYLVLQAIVERVTGQSFGEVVRHEVADPAGADDIITDADTFTQRVPPGFVPFFTVPARIHTGFDAAGVGYGYLAGSVEQLGRYASRQLADLLSADPAAALSRSGTVATGGAAGYGFGWFVERMAGADGTATEVRWHSGAVPGFFTHVALIPERDLAVVLVANRYGEMESERFAAAARSLVRSELGIPDRFGFGPGAYEATLATLCFVGTVLVAWLTRIVITLIGGDLRPSRTGTVCVRVGLVAVTGGLLLFGGLAGVPRIVGAPLTVISNWAPDIALLFWILVAEIFLVTGLLVLRHILRHERLVGILGRRGAE
ncbi:beta-lactamase family protein [Nocardia sp. CDC159]|uniref:Beta-lactamase family protein n=1 Tax=Nocardia pulmonis TaxID=2951408 RepID=A0A9X2J0C8_9NOCA|nr:MULTISPECIES: serine hydrolase domain-containing protein [Nocardia]MCM6778418.1 beta-lactamase family protein [Nocardia pulmonis]MCM6791307.1 beta-lactamase family protein [Nocardia sp. CDC159]